MFITIRTDASTAIETGHVMRCLTLAGVLEKSAISSFICREHDGHLCDLIEERGFFVHRLSRVLILLLLLLHLIHTMPPGLGYHGRRMLRILLR